MEFKYWSILSRLSLGMMLKTSPHTFSNPWLVQCNAMQDFQNTPYICWQLLEEQGEPIVVPCSCLKNLSWKVKTQFSKTNFRSCITSSFSRPMVLHLKEQPYLCLASGSSICSQNKLVLWTYWGPWGQTQVWKPMVLHLKEQPYILTGCFAITITHNG